MLEPNCYSERVLKILEEHGNQIGSNDLSAKVLSILGEQRIHQQKRWIDELKKPLMIEELSTVALVEFDTHNRFKARAARGSAVKGLEIVDRLDQLPN